MQFKKTLYGWEVRGFSLIVGFFLWGRIINYLGEDYSLFLKDYCKNNWLSTGDSLQNSCDVTWWGWLLKPLLRPELRCYLHFCFDTADILGNTIKDGNDKLLNFNHGNLITWIIAEWSHGWAEGWVGWPYVTYCSSLFASGSVDSSLVQSVPGWAAMSLTSDSLFALVRWGAFIKILSLSRAP